MFTGIIETIGRVVSIEREKANLHISLESELGPELKIDQSVSHNGVCLTVVAIKDNVHTVTAIYETIIKTNLNNLKVGSQVNLERATILGTRLDGHIVQGHVDATGTCTKIKEENGSWRFSFEYEINKKHITIEKGSITVNGVSLTVVNSTKNSFEVAIIPYTYRYTQINEVTVGSVVNLEFDVIGKYVAKLYDF